MATAPAPSEHGSWAAAYLMLVCGVAQLDLGIRQALLAPGTPSLRVIAVGPDGTPGNAAILAGTLPGSPRWRTPAACLSLSWRC